MKVVLDTNVLVSLVLGGTVGILVDYWDHDRFQVLVTVSVVDEYATVLARPKFGLPYDIVEAIIAYVQRKAEFVVPTETITEIIDDPKDNMFLESAIAGRANYVVSGDPHLNALKNFRGIPIITPREFLDRLEGKTGD